MSSPAVELRSGRPSDAATVAALATQVFLDTYAADGVRPHLAREAFHHYSLDRFAARLDEPARRFVLAEVADGVLGFAEVIVRPLEAPAGDVSGAELVRLYVQPAAQRRGIGRALLASAERVAASAALSVLWLTAWEGNLRARSFYARLGYADIGPATYSFQGSTYANRVLAKTLSCA